LAVYFPWEKPPHQSRRAMWCWTALTLLVLLVASVIVGATWLGVGAQQQPEYARLAVAQKVWLPAMLVVWIGSVRALHASGRDLLSNVTTVLAPIVLGISVLVLSQLVRAPAAVVVALLVLANLAAYFLVWLLFWPRNEDRCPTWLS
jgi:cytochrome bd-type quinol oxidase subunit 2